MMQVVSVHGVATLQRHLPIYQSMLPTPYAVLKVLNTRRSCGGAGNPLVHILAPPPASRLR